MHESAYRRFKREVRHFFSVSVMNIAFAALLMAFGLIVVVQEAVSMYDAYAAGEYVPFFNPVLLVAGVAMLIGIGWIITSAKVFEGVASIKDDLTKLKWEDASGAEPGQTEKDEDLTRLIVRMLSHYRDNHATIHRMIYVCMLGSCSIFALGFIASLEYLDVSINGFTFTIGPDPLLLPPFS